MGKFYIVSALVVLLLFYKVQFSTAEDSDDCSHVSLKKESGEIKFENCILKLGNSFPTCDVIPQRGRKNFCIKCLESNVIQLIAKSPDEGVLKCSAPFPIDLDFLGEQTSINTYIRFSKTIKNDTSDSPKTIYNVESFLLQSGVYTVRSIQNSSAALSVYILHGKGGPQTKCKNIQLAKDEGPYLTLNGQTHTINISSSASFLKFPCFVRNFEANVYLYKKVDGKLKKIQDVQFQPAWGFTIPLNSSSNEEIAGEYLCTTDWAQDVDFVKIIVTSRKETCSPRVDVESNEDEDDGFTTRRPHFNHVPHLTIDIWSNQISCSLRGIRWENKEGVYIPPDTPIMFGLESRNPTESRIKSYCISKLVGPSNKCPGQQVGIISSRPDQADRKLGMVIKHGIVACYGTGKYDQLSATTEFFTGLDGQIHTDFQKTPNNENIPIQAFIQLGINIQGSNSVPEMQPKIFYRNVSYEFTCSFVSHILVQPVAWSIHFQDGSVKEILDDLQEFKDGWGDLFERAPPPDFHYLKGSSVRILKIPEGAVGIKCGASMWNSEEWIYSSVINIPELTEPRPPTLKSFSNDTVVLLSNSTFQSFICEAVSRGDPEAEIIWEKEIDRSHSRIRTRGSFMGPTTRLNGPTGDNNKVSESDFIVSKNVDAGSARLIFAVVKPTINGRYVCSAKNFVGSASKTLTVKVVDSLENVE